MKTMIDLSRSMRDAMRLIKGGDLNGATEAIQRGLGVQAGPTPGDSEGGPGSGSPWIDGESCRIEDAPPEKVDHPDTARPHNRCRTSAGEFMDDKFISDAGEMDYKLFIPAGLDVTAAPPLLVMLHGCTQSPDDFARGTRMNALAQDRGYVVAYPAQSTSKNMGKCWNWFRRQDQRRGEGEPAMIAALTRYLVRTHGLDERRVYVAGLSAGGAMAAVLASTYPDIYAAIGVHSGLPFGVAHDLPSALAAMKQGLNISAALIPQTRIDLVPTIVFHGDRDTTVDPCNGEAVIAQSIGLSSVAPSPADALSRIDERGSVVGGHAYTRTVFKNADGSVAAEQWIVHGAGHAWFGGDLAGSYTDPSGPDASENMLRFFAACMRRPLQ